MPESLTRTILKELESHGYLCGWMDDEGDGRVTLRAVAMRGDDKGQWYKAEGLTRYEAAVDLANLVGIALDEEL